METERFADRICGLEGECVGQRLGGEHDSLLPLEQRPILASDGLVFVSVQRDARILERGEELSRA